MTVARNPISSKESGIYYINCKDSKKMYTGKAKTELETRAKKDFKNIKNGGNREISSSSSSRCMEGKTYNGS